MVMKNILLFLFVSLIASASFSQKTKVKDNIATVDGVPFLNWDLRNGSEISISGINSTQEEIFAMYLDYLDPNKVTSANPQGRVSWIELNFVTLQKKCEIDSRGQGGLVKFIYENNLYVDNVLNAENVEKLVYKYGMRFSEGRPKGTTVNVFISE